VQKKCHPNKKSGYSRGPQVNSFKYVEFKAKKGKEAGNEKRRIVKFYPARGLIEVQWGVEFLTKILRRV